MTKVAFYTGVADRLPYVCRLLRKVQQSGAQIGVCGPTALLDRLDAALWRFEPTAFVPHLRFTSGTLPNGALGKSPVLLTETPAELPHRALLLNLGQTIPDGFERFERVLEVVSNDAEQAELGRQRFKQYKDLGHNLTHHKASD
jgi:DNA polymerase-3 subunit chi